MISRALPMLALAVVFASTNMTAHAQSKGDQALLDALVRKGVLTDKEATEISAETAKEVTNGPTDQIKIGDWVKELRLSGDLRIRNQWDQRTPMILTNPLFGLAKERSSLARASEARMVNIPPFGIASRAFRARLTRAVSSWVRST